MNRCENYTLACEARDCCECDMFWWDGTGEVFLDTPKFNTAKIAVVSHGRPNFTTLANMIANNEDIKIEIKGDLK